MPCVAGHMANTFVVQYLEYTTMCQKKHVVLHISTFSLMRIVELEKGNHSVLSKSLLGTDGMHCSLAVHARCGLNS